MAVVAPSASGLTLAAIEGEPRCAFCFLSTSLLGQSELQPITNVSNLEEAYMEQMHERQRRVPGNDTRQRHGLSRRGHSKNELFAALLSTELVDEIDMVGLPDDVTHQLLDADNTGHIRTHFCCAAWSDGVTQGDNQTLENVDHAIVAAWHQLCSVCDQYGASITCQQENCRKKFHYPCAIAAGGYIDVEQMRFLCAVHFHDSAAAGEMPNVVCKRCRHQGQYEDLLLCTSCCQWLHASCLENPVSSGVRVRAGWQCSDCKICQQCGWPSDDNRMLVCEMCDKAYHTYCNVPPLSSVPKTAWKCKNCRQCTDCGSRQPGSGVSSRWHLRYTVCDSCYQQRNKGLYCPVCSRAYRHQKQKTLRQCRRCSKQVHFDCDKPRAEEAGDDYVCPVCVAAPVTAAGLDDSRGTTTTVSLPQDDDSRQTSVSTIGDDDDLAAFMKKEMGPGTGSLSSSSPFSEAPAPIPTSFASALDTSEPNTRESTPNEQGGSGSSTNANNRAGGSVAGRRNTSHSVDSTGGKGKASVPRKRGCATGTKRGRPPNSGKQASVLRQLGSSATASTARRGRGGGKAGRAANKFASHLIANLQKEAASHGSSEETTSLESDETAATRADEDYVHTVVVTKSTDAYVFAKDLCVICGSIGKDEEGNMLCCTQCAQCYHSYCANVNLSAVLLSRGWRCLDCTVCEGCGQGTDEPHLLLCDNCDVSFHTYCLNPPLEHIPSGPWRCKWCAQCSRCKGVLERGTSHRVPVALPGGEQTTTTGSINLCAGCGSLQRCAKCSQCYLDDDMIIQCQQCMRWLHAKCEQLLSEEHVEKACEHNFRCSLCRPSYMSALSVNAANDDSVSQFLTDGVLLTKSGFDTIQAARVRPVATHNGPGSMHMRLGRGAPQMGPAGLFGGQRVAQSYDLDDSNFGYGDRDMNEFERSDSVDGSLSGLADNYPGPGGEPTQFSYSSGGRGSRGGGRGRYSKLHKIGVGGFVVRPSRQRYLQQYGNGNGDGGVVDEEEPEPSSRMSRDDEIDKSANAQKRRKRRSRKTQLEDSYPGVLAKNFFADAPELEELPRTDLQQGPAGPRSPSLDTTPAPDKPSSAAKHLDCTLTGQAADLLTRQHAFTERVPGSGGAVGGVKADPAAAASSANTVAGAVNAPNYKSQVEDRTLEHAFANLPDIENINDLYPTDADALFTMLNEGDDEEPIDELMDTVATGPLLGGLSEDSIVAARSRDQFDTNRRIQQQRVEQPPAATQPPVPADHQIKQEPSAAQPHVFKQEPEQPIVMTDQQIQQQQQLMHQQRLQQQQMQQQQAALQQQPVVLHAQPHPLPLVDSRTPSSTPTESVPAKPEGGERTGGTERWEQDEPLGAQATIAAVLHANMNAPQLKQTHPVWADRIKQIQKLWRQLDASSRQQFVQMARDNRAASKQHNKQLQQQAASSGGTPKPSPAPSTPVAHDPQQIQQPQQFFPQMQQQTAESFKMPSTPTQQFTALHSQQPSTSQQIHQMTQVRLPAHRPGSLPIDSPTQQQQQHGLPPPAAQQSLLEDLLEQERRELRQPSEHNMQTAAQSQQAMQQQLTAQQQQQQQQYLQQQHQHPLQQPSAVIGQQPQPPQMPQQPQQQLQQQHLAQQAAAAAAAYGAEGAAVAQVPVAPIDQQHAYLMQQQDLVERRLKECEAELNGLRKQKKNLANRQRQLKKQNEQQGLGPHLTEHDTQQMAHLTHTIQTMQKQLEMIKKDAKQAATQCSDYVSMRRAQQQQQHSPRPQHPLRSPLPMTPMSPSMQPAAAFGMVAAPAPFGMAAAQQRPAVMSPRPPQHTMMPGTSAVVPPPQQQQHTPVMPVEDKKPPRKRNRKRNNNDNGSPSTSTMPPVVHTPAQTVWLALKYCDPGVLECVDVMVDLVSQQMDGPLSPEQHSQMPSLHKRLVMMQNAGCNIIGGLGALLEPALAAQAAAPAPPPKRKRVRNRPSAANSRTASDQQLPLRQHTSPHAQMTSPSQHMSPQMMPSQSAAHLSVHSQQQQPQMSQQEQQAHQSFTQRCRMALKQLPALPPQQPRVRADLSCMQPVGMTTLPDRPDRPMLQAVEYGAVTLKFLPDFYAEAFGEQGSKPWTVIRDASTCLSVPIVEHKPAKQEKPNLELLHKRVLPQTSDTVYFDPPETQGSSESSSAHVNYPQLQLSAHEQLFSCLSHTPRFLPAYPPFALIKTTSGADAQLPQVKEEWPQQQEAKNDPEAALASSTFALGISQDAAAQVAQMMERLAALVNAGHKIKYELSIDTPPQTPDKPASIEPIDVKREPTFSPTGAPGEVKCRSCERFTPEVAVRKRLAELGLTPDDEQEHVMFCSLQCFFRFALSHKSAIGQHDVKMITPGALDSETLMRLSDTYPEIFPVENLHKFDVAPTDTKRSSAIADIIEAVASEGCESAVPGGRLDEIIQSVVYVQPPYTQGVREQVLHVRQLGEHLGSSKPADTAPDATASTRWKGHRWQLVSRQLRRSFEALTDQIKAVRDKHIAHLVHTRSSLQFPEGEPTEDERVCQLCQGKGDCEPQAAGRLLNLDAGTWLHVNCALWSSEVYETVSGSLMNCEAAVRRSVSSVCAQCEAFGATLQCYTLKCDNRYHFPCALQAKCAFFKDKTMYCREHALQQPNLHVMCLKSLAVYRRIYIERDENRLIAKLFTQHDDTFSLRVGSLIFQHIGQLLPHQLKTFHNKDHIFPCGYAMTRVYWAPDRLQARLRYDCRIGERDGLPEFTVSFKQDEQAQSIVVSDPSATGVWQHVLGQVRALREQSGQLRLFTSQLSGEALFGLAETSITKMIESLPGVDTILTYSFKHGGSPLMDLPLAVNPSGCARCEPRFRTYLKRPHPVTANSPSKGTGSKLDYQELLQLSASMQDLQASTSQSSKWSLYKRMKADWRNIVHLGRSKIHGLGLYASRDIEMHGFIIEYVGETIRSEVAEVREKRYEAANRGIYMFRVDAEQVVDASMAGGPARYINHSCDPNCTTQIIRMNNGEGKIVVMAARPIQRDEELTYDYQFDIEDDCTDKIPCYCGAPNCRKWMN